MKKTLLFLALLVLTFFHAEISEAQSNWEAGIRIGDNFSIDATIPLAAAPRLHPAVYTERFGVGAYFDWLFAIAGGPEGLKFYPGVGPEFFFESRFDFDVAGNFGAEYSFKFPLTIGFDWRPGFRVTNGFRWKSSNWGFTARFRFGEGVKFTRVN